MNFVIVATKRQNIIPSKIRRKLNIRKGTKLYIEEKGDELCLKPIALMRNLETGHWEQEIGQGG